MMSTTHRRKSDSDYETGVEEILEQVSSGRVTVQRVLEFIRGERSSDEMKGSDWLNVINHVRRHTDETLVLYDEGEVSVKAITRTDYGAIEVAEWGPRFGRRHEFETFDIVKDDLHKTSWDVLLKAEAKQRFDAFVRANGGDA